ARPGRAAETGTSCAAPPRSPCGFPPSAPPLRNSGGMLADCAPIRETLGAGRVRDRRMTRRPGHRALSGNRVTRYATGADAGRASGPDRQPAFRLAARWVAQHVAAAPDRLDIVLAPGGFGELFPQLADEDVDDLQLRLVHAAVEVVEEHLLGERRALP